MGSIDKKVGKEMEKSTKPKKRTPKE
jgi:hypothetical protein